MSGLRFFSVRKRRNRVSHVGTLMHAACAGGDVKTESGQADAGTKYNLSLRLNKTDSIQRSEAPSQGFASDTRYLER